LAVGPPSRIATDLAAVTLRHGGVNAVREWMTDLQVRRAVALFVVDDEGRDVLGREVPAAALASARQIVARGEDGRGVRRVAAPGGESYLLFVTRMPGARQQRPPPPPPLEPWVRIFICLVHTL